MWANLIFGAELTPEVFIFDSQKKLRYHGAIDDNPKDPKHVNIQYARDAIFAILEGTEVEIKETNFIGCSIKWSLS